MSGLHPTCCVLSGLEKVGNQVAAGGFGDIWKSSVGGQTVAVKSMRLFRDADVKSALKVCFPDHGNLLYILIMTLVFEGIWTRSSHLAAIFASQRTTLLRSLLFRRTALSGFAVDGKWPPFGIFKTCSLRH